MNGDGNVRCDCVFNTSIPRNEQPIEWQLDLKEFGSGSEEHPLMMRSVNRCCKAISKTRSHSDSLPQSECAENTGKGAFSC